MSKTRYYLHDPHADCWVRVRKRKYEDVLRWARRNPDVHVYAIRWDQTPAPEKEKAYALVQAAEYNFILVLIGGAKVYETSRTGEWAKRVGQFLERWREAHPQYDLRITMDT